ncbi:TonB-dependent receptor [Zhouia amylolytica]|nr:TonB-dependent receptor [Zhouia amylolytica]
MRTLFCGLLMLFSLCAFSQTTITGKVVDQDNQPIPGANVVIIGKAEGAVTDFNGRFSLTTDQTPPFKLRVTSIGFSSVELEVTSDNQNLDIILEEAQTQLDEIVVSASRTPERIFESPVTVERFGLKEIKNAAAPDFYSGLENLKGVDINTNSLTFQSINTRGFATFANNRFVQLVDGMDNTSPALNFVLGNLLGMTELDVNSVELLPGASSALYGANAFNGILFMTSKDPFKFNGLSAYAKSGFTSQEAAGDNQYYDFGIRAAHKFSDKFAGKVNFSYLNGTDWWAVSEEDVLNPGRTRAHQNYDGLNIYGDEVSTNIRAVGAALADMGLIPSGAENLLPDENVSRTGYAERDLTDYNAESVKFDASLHYRPFADDFEIIYQGKLGKGTTIYQGSNRYSIKDFFLQQHKLEFRNDNFFVRGYITSEDAGDSYDMRFAGININRAWKDDSTWFGEYAGAYLQASLAGANSEQAHMVARQTADTGRLIPGTAAFESTFNRVISDPDFTKGAQFKDETKMRHVDVNYNFSHLTDDFAEVQVGGSFREYVLNSFGTIFTDANGPISYSEIGAYAQIQKKFADDRLKVTASGRYDKSQLFDGFFSPRLSLGYTMGGARNHNLRASYQTGFRNPTTQDLFIGLDAGRAILVGSAEENLDRDVREFRVNNIAANGGNDTATILGREAYENSFTLNSVNNGTFQKSDVSLVEPEKVQSFEVGYRGEVSKVTIDLSVYYNIYDKFIANETVIVPFYGEVGDNSLSLLAMQSGDFKPYQTYTNSDADVKSYGASIGLDYRIFGNFDLGGSYTYAKQDFDQASAPDFRTSFNTPEHKVKVSFGNTDLFENFGFNIDYRWSDSYFWQATFADGNISSYSVFDAQINYRVPSLKSTFKVGGSNIGGKDYFTAIGTGYIGSQFYVSWVINN